MKKLSVLLPCLLFCVLFTCGKNCQAEASFPEILPYLRVEGSQPYLDSVGSFLAKLKADDRFRPLFDFYTLGFNSASLQPSTFERPRAVLFGSTGKFILTFNSDPSFNGGASLETVEFDPIVRVLKFREIIFKGELPAWQQQTLISADADKEKKSKSMKEFFNLDLGEISINNNQVIVSESNPQKCLDCHSVSQSYPNQARYIWNSYPQWPDFYGSEDDSLTEGERAGYKLYEKIKAVHSRYSILGPLKNLGIESSAKAKLAAFSRRPNLLMTLITSFNQAQVYAKMILDKWTQSQAEGFARKEICYTHDYLDEADFLAYRGIPSSLRILSPVQEDPSMERSYNTAIQTAFSYGYDLPSLVTQQIVLESISSSPRYGLMARKILASFSRDNLDRLRKHRELDPETNKLRELTYADLPTGMLKLLSEQVNSDYNYYTELKKKICARSGRKTLKPESQY